MKILEVTLLAMLTVVGCGGDSEKGGATERSSDDREAALEKAYSPLEAKRDACLAVVTKAVAKRDGEPVGEVDAAALAVARPLRVLSAKNKFERPVAGQADRAFLEHRGGRAPRGNVHAPGGVRAGDRAVVEGPEDGSHLEGPLRPSADPAAGCIPRTQRQPPKNTCQWDWPTGESPSPLIRSSTWSPS